MRPAIILFAKAPVPGRVKTRLAAQLGDIPAAELHRAFVLDTIDLLEPFSDCVDVEIHSDVTTGAWPVERLQHGPDLGARMLHALSDSLRIGRPQVCILGSDSPTLPSGHLSALLASPEDVALGPTEDGGYYAIACRRVHPAMFLDVPWSSGDTLVATERAVRACGLSVTRGPLWYDVDEFADLERLRADWLSPRRFAVLR